MVVLNSVFGQSLTPDQQYQIFPQNVLGNVLYQEEVWLFSQENCAVRSAYYFAASLAHIIWCSHNKEGFFVVWPKNAKDQFDFVQDRFLLSRTQNSSVLFYADSDEKLHRLNINFRSINGFVHNEKDLVGMFHVAQSTFSDSTADQNSRPVYQYRVHIWNTKTNELQTLPNRFFSQASRISLAWEQQVLRVSTREGEVYQFAISNEP